MKLRNTEEEKVTSLEENRGRQWREMKIETEYELTYCVKGGEESGGRERERKRVKLMIDREERGSLQVRKRVKIVREGDGRRRDAARL